MSSLALAAGCLALLSGCVTHWPDAPFTDTAATLDPGLAKTLQAKHPGAKLITPVYRRHMENRSGNYRVVSQRFLFEDASGQPFRGVIGEDGQIGVTPVLFLDGLPPKLHDRFFTGPAALAPGGQVTGQVWQFDNAAEQMKVYEFEFTCKTKGGVGMIVESASRASADYILPSANE